MSFVIELYAHFEEQLLEVFHYAYNTFGNEKIIMSRHYKEPIQISRGNILTVEMKIEELILKNPHEIILWDGEIGKASFNVMVPINTYRGAKNGYVLIRINGMQIAKICFVINIGKQKQNDEILPIEEKYYESAFFSYAHEDASTVLHYFGGMKKVRLNLTVNMDIMSLRSGDKFREKINELILCSDIFFLFWSIAASKSQWVEREWKYALINKGIDFIEPIPLEPPLKAPPPKELADHIHFNDETLAWQALIRWK
ncbi:MAG: toll/interleukin-1 receptor domain-containing protein [Candidatus Hodarchaeota archaeon]